MQWHAWDVWKRDLASGAETPIQPGRADINRRSVWSGGSVLFVRQLFANGSKYSGISQLVRVGGDDVEVLLEAPDPREILLNPVLTPDGATLIYRFGGGGQCQSCVIHSMRLGVDTVGTPIVGDPGGVAAPALSPDGRWLAYEVNVAGQKEIHLRPYPDTRSSRFPVSARGGTGPVWSPNGRELFYVAGDGMMTSARIGTDAQDPVEDRDELLPQTGTSRGPATAGTTCIRTDSAS